MKNIAIALGAYGIVLILIGLTGYLSNPEKAKTALMSGGTFGLIYLGFAGLARKGWRPAVPAALGVAAFLAVVFVWRASASWMAFAAGDAGKLIAAVLITTMLAATLGVAGYLIQARRQARTPGSSPG